MLLYRRLLVIPLMLLLLVALFSALLFHRLDSTFLSPNFYKNQMSSAKFYDFLLTGFLNTAIEGVIEGSPNNEGLFEELDVKKESVSRSVTTAVSSEWLKREFESGIDQVIPYVSGDADEFEVNVDFKHQAEVLLVESKAIQRDSRSYEFVMESFVDPLVNDLAGDDSLFGLNVPPELVRDMTYNVITREWVHDQIDVVIDSVTPYLVGDEETFSISVPLNDRAEVALDEIIRLMRGEGGYEVLYSEIVEAEVLESVGESVEILDSIVLTDEDIVNVLRRALPVDWVELQSENIIYSGKPYLVGKEDHFSTTIYLADTKANALDVVSDVAVQKVMNRIEALPECSGPVSSEYIESVRFGNIPDCIPSNVNMELLRSSVHERVSGVVTPLILELIPDEIAFTDDDLRELLLEVGGQESLDQFDKARQVISDGWVYTDQNLRDDFAGQLPDAGDDDNFVTLLQDTRTVIAEGWGFDQDDLRASVGSGDSLESFEKARTVFGWMSILPWLLFPASAAIVLGIAFLGGTDWRRRVVWGAGALTTVSVLITIVWILLYSALLRPQLIAIVESFNTDSSSQDGIVRAQGLLVTKVSEMLESSLDLFASGISNASVALLVISLVVFFMSYFWHSLRANYARASVRMRQLPVRLRAIRS